MVCLYPFVAELKMSLLYFTNSSYKPDFQRQVWSATTANLQQAYTGISFIL